jgi:hypothetical protein
MPLQKEDFLAAMTAIVPASHRSSLVFAKPLAKHLEVLLQPLLMQSAEALRLVFPLAARTRAIAPGSHQDDNESPAAMVSGDLVSSSLVRGYSECVLCSGSSRFGHVSWFVALPKWDRFISVRQFCTSLKTILCIQSTCPAYLATQGVPLPF